MIVVRHAEAVMGTVVSFVVHGGELPETTLRAALGRACDGLHEDDAMFSTWRADSPMSRVRRDELAVRDAPPEIVEVLVACASARDLSGGWFDPWAMPGGVDPTGLVKGWAAQRAAAELARWGVPAALVNAGGDIVTFGERAPGHPWQVGIRDPRRAHRIDAAVPVDGAIATSGVYERPGEVLDPFTGRPARRLRAATVVGPELGLADALATGLLAAGPDGLAQVAAVPGYSARIVGPGGVVRVSPGFPATVPAPAVARAA
ncbi:MAG: FAD:protein transferase [Solirubrobacteraceae bacterium]|jgi:thiamine biosynthesis lipoprotein|nr:FAD:protein transferase [Solirubrobacteraceae bacterium]